MCMPAPHWHSVRSATPGWAASHAAPIEEDPNSRGVVRPRCGPGCCGDTAPAQPVSNRCRELRSTASAEAEPRRCRPA
jgi:hypothetical protein